MDTFVAISTVAVCSLKCCFAILAILAVLAVEYSRLLKAA